MEKRYSKAEEVWIHDGGYEEATKVADNMFEGLERASDGSRTTEDTKVRIRRLRGRKDRFRVVLYTRIKEETPKETKKRRKKQQ